MWPRWFADKRTKEKTQMLAKTLFLFFGIEKGKIQSRFRSFLPGSHWWAKAQGLSPPLTPEPGTGKKGKELPGRGARKPVITSKHWPLQDMTHFSIKVLHYN
jgi:hypothetical protein